MLRHQVVVTTRQRSMQWRWCKVIVSRGETRERETERNEREREREQMERGNKRWSKN